MLQIQRRVNPRQYEGQLLRRTIGGAPSKHLHRPVRLILSMNRLRSLVATTTSVAGLLEILAQQAQGCLVVAYAPTPINVGEVNIAHKGDVKPWALYAEVWTRVEETSGGQNGPRSCPVALLIVIVAL